MRRFLSCQKKPPLEAARSLSEGSETAKRQPMFVTQFDDYRDSTVLAPFRRRAGAINPPSPRRDMPIGSGTGVAINWTALTPSVVTLMSVVMLPPYLFQDRRMFPLESGVTPVQTA